MRMVEIRLPAKDRPNGERKILFFFLFLPPVDGRRGLFGRGVAIIKKLYTRVRINGTRTLYASTL